MKVIPENILRGWEREALSQGILPTEFAEFLRTKESLYWETLQDKEEAKKAETCKVFTNKERNKLTTFGQRFVLDYISGMEPVERVCKFALYEMQDLQHNLSKAKSEEQRLFVKSLREVWFSHLKEMMREMRISKETLMTFGLDFKAAKNFYFQTI